MQYKTPQQQLNSVCHFALIKILVDHQLGLQGIDWEDFISRDFFNTPQVLSKVEHEIGGPSHQYERDETATMPECITYQRGSRNLFAAAKRVLSPPKVEGASLPTSTTQVQDQDKKSMYDEGPSSEQEVDFILIQDDDADVERAKWIIKYLEQRNKQPEDQHEIMELQNILEDQQAAQRSVNENTPIQQEIEAD